MLGEKKKATFALKAVRLKFYFWLWERDGGRIILE